MAKYSDEIMHIITPSSSHYVPFLSTLLASIILNKSKNDRYHFHVLTEDITEKEKVKINYLKKYGNFDIEYVYPNQKLIAGIKECVSKHINNLCNYKMHIASLFPNIHKAIILEGDMVVLSSLKELYDTNIENTPFAAVKDPWCEDIQDRYDIPKNYRYCNTGMFLANLDLWRVMNIEEKFKNLISKYNDKLLFPDQDIFNMAFYKDIKYLPQKWNIYVNIKYNHIEEELEAYHNGIEKFSGIVHYAAPEKPWLQECNYSEFFWIYSKKTPFYKNVLKNYLFNSCLSTIKYVFCYKKLKFEYVYCLVLSYLCFKKKTYYKEKMLTAKSKLDVASKIIGRKGK